MTTDALSLWNTYAPKIHAYIYRRTSDPVLSEDLTAQTFLNALEALRCGKGPRTSESGWVYRIAHNLVIDYYRTRERQKIGELEEWLPYQKDSPDEVAELQLNVDALLKAMRRLTDEQAQVLYLRYIDGCSFGEIAALLDKTEGAVKALQHRGLNSLRVLLQERIA